MGRPRWFVELLKKAYNSPLKKLTFKLTRMPFIGKFLQKSMAEDILFCIPGDQIIQIGESIKSKTNVLPSQVVDHFIREASHRWIMNFCICRTSNGCKDYHQEWGCLFMGEAVTKINPAFGRLVTVDEALEYARKCRESGLVHFIGRNVLDEMWLGATPGEKLLTVCNCCPCCCISGGIKYMADGFRDRYSKLPGAEIKVDREACVGCGSCEKVCIYDGIFVANKKAVIIEKKCMSCGRCVAQCPKKAISLTLHDMEFIEKSIMSISKHVNVKS